MELGRVEPVADAVRLDRASLVPCQKHAGRRGSRGPLLVGGQRREARGEPAQNGVGAALRGEFDDGRPGVFGIRATDHPAEQSRDDADAVAGEQCRGLLLGGFRRDGLEVGLEPALRVGLARLGIGRVERAPADEEPAVPVERVGGKGIADQIVLSELRLAQVRGPLERLVFG